MGASIVTAQPLAEPVSFGQRYWLTKLLAVGGMAEIYLARQNAMHGFEKDVVIKRLKPKLAQDRRIREMFLDEARISAALNHPNVVHVYDVDEEAGVPYIAMEYIIGEELNALCRRGLQLDNFLPMEHSVELIRQAAAGMGYFHAKRRADGKELQIVHCDISPTNFMVTEDGFLKIIDFGIARARNTRFRDESTVPGKLSYMSPEQARRERVDHRTDIFALGVVLYEITVGKRLFRGPAQEVYKRLIECDVTPPTFVRNDFPGPLESIIMRALEAHPDDRYQSAYDIADDLEEFMRKARLRSAPVRIARYLDELNVAAGGARRTELITEAEMVGFEEDDLDFDRGAFDDHEPLPPDQVPDEHAIAAANWDEYEEDDREMAMAMGIDPDMLDPITRTPIPPLAGDDELFAKPNFDAVAPGSDDEESGPDDDDEGSPPSPDENADEVEATGENAEAKTKAKTKTKTKAKNKAKNKAKTKTKTKTDETKGGDRSEGSARSKAEPEKGKPAARKPRARTPVLTTRPAPAPAGGLPMNWMIIGGVAAAITAVGAYLLLGG
jgi:serine/threonine protein kinase